MCTRPSIECGFSVSFLFPRGDVKSIQGNEIVQKSCTGDVSSPEFECHRFNISETDGNDLRQEIESSDPKVREKGEYGQRVFCLKGIDLPSNEEAKSGHAGDTEKKDQTSTVFFQKDVAQTWYEPA